MELLEKAKFTYQAKVNEVTDGDTLVCTFDLGFNVNKADTKIRLLDVDTHEIHFVSHSSEEYKRGIEETEFVREWLNDARKSTETDWPFIVDTVKGDNTGKYGRYLAYVYRVDSMDCLNDAILEEFDDVAYNG